MIIEKYPVKGESNPYRAKLKCDSCGHITDTSFGKQREKKINDAGGKTFCRSCNNRIEGKKKRGKPSPKLGKSYEHLRGVNSSQWKGGKYIDSGGYVLILVDNRHHKVTGWRRYKKEHTLVMEKYLSRKLKKNENIHHIDVNKQNNDINNLIIYTDEQDHKNMHKSLEKIGIDLLKLGLVIFDKKTRQYKINFDVSKL